LDVDIFVSGWVAAQKWICFRPEKPYRPQYIMSTQTSKMQVSGVPTEEKKKLKPGQAAGAKGKQWVKPLTAAEKKAAEAKAKAEWEAECELRGATRASNIRYAGLRMSEMNGY